MMLLRLRPDQKLDHTEKRIEQAGINADTSYEEMPDEDYWKMRNILIEEHSSFKDIPKAPPYEYSQQGRKNNDNHSKFASSSCYTGYFNSRKNIYFPDLDSCPGCSLAY